MHHFASWTGMQILDLAQILPVVLRDVLNEGSFQKSKEEEWLKKGFISSVLNCFVLLAQYISEMFSSSLPKKQRQSLEEHMVSHHALLCKVSRQVLIHFLQ